MTTLLQKTHVFALAITTVLAAACAGSTPTTEGSDSKTTSDESATQLVWPMSGSIVRGTAPGPGGHPGIDIGAGVGTQIYAAAAGQVVDSFVDPGGYGCNVVINHTGGSNLGQGIVSIYGHMSQIDVHPGQSVSSGTPLGKSGGQAGAPCSGNATGPHLHFEFRNNSVSILGWDANVPRGSNVQALTPIDAHIDGLADNVDCSAACANFGCQCVDGACNGGYCPGTGCSDQEMANCQAFGANCVDHQCNGGYAPGSGCTAKEQNDCSNFGANCVDHQCNGGYAPGSGCTAKEQADCSIYGVNCVDHQCMGGFGLGSGCTAKEENDCQAYGCQCVDHGCSGGFCAGTGCTGHETLDCQAEGCDCRDHQCSGGACGN